jgi:hypothetical protein
MRRSPHAFPAALVSLACSHLRTVTTGTGGIAESVPGEEIL